MKFKFGNVNAYHHRRTCVKLNWLIFNLVIYVPNKSLAKISRYYGNMIVVATVEREILYGAKFRVADRLGE